jgi:hypothetical protein
MTCLWGHIGEEKKQKNNAGSGGSDSRFTSPNTRKENRATYSDPILADMEKSMQAANGLSKEIGLSTRTEKSGKRNLRDEIEGLDGIEVSPNHGQIWKVVKNFERGMDRQKVDALDENKNGLGMAEVVEQPCQLQ